MKVLQILFFVIAPLHGVSFALAAQVALVSGVAEDGGKLHLEMFAQKDPNSKANRRYLARLQKALKREFEELVVWASWAQGEAKALTGITWGAVHYRRGLNRLSQNGYGFT